MFKYMALYRKRGDFNTPYSSFGVLLRSLVVLRRSRPRATGPIGAVGRLGQRTWSATFRVANKTIKDIEKIFTKKRAKSLDFTRVCGVFCDYINQGMVLHESSNCIT